MHTLFHRLRIGSLLEQSLYIHNNFYGKMAPGAHDGAHDASEREIHETSKTGILHDLQLVP
jgi:hypothetical protein